MSFVIGAISLYNTSKPQYLDVNVICASHAVIAKWSLVQFSLVTCSADNVGNFAKCSKGPVQLFVKAVPSSLVPCLKWSD
jgi:hypothetical protein